MASELAMTTAALAGVALLGATVGVGMTYFDPLEQPTHSTTPSQEDLVTRVFFEATDTSYHTRAHEFPVDGVVGFDALPVDLTNVTYVVVTMHARLDGVALNDEFELTVGSPDGRSDIGSYTGPTVNVNGYDINPRMINWKRTLSPTDITYETTNVQQALQWSAENHTRTDAQGDWSAVLEVGTPGIPGRSGNISLTYTFTHYEAVAALVDNSRPEPACEEGHEAPDNATNEDVEAKADSMPECTSQGEDQEEPGKASDPAAKERVVDPAAKERVDPRTFITQTPVARAVDRDPGPDGPL